MNVPNYFSVDYIYYAEGPFNGYNLEINQPVGYKWYQSQSILEDPQ